ncbi:MAG: hypothetical protein ACFE0Q_16485 [Anaerolineae bacterium]
MPTSNIQAQDTEPTPMPVLPEASEDDSAAPVAPGIEPPVITDPGDDNAPLPEATEAVDEAPADTSDDIPASSGDTCPAGIQDSFNAVEILCSDITSGEACIGNGTVESVLSADLDQSFAQANDRVDFELLDEVTLISNGAWTVIRAEIPLNTTDGSNATSTVFAYGDLTLTETGQVADGSARSGTVIANQGMNVRRAPNNDGVVVWQLRGGQQIVVTGISADRQWIRMVIPNEFAGTGWVYAPYIEVEGGDETLDVVAENSPQPDLSPVEFGPGQSFELLSALPSEDCADVPISGLLMQSPSSIPDALRVRINSAEVQFNGTIFVQAQVGEALRVSVLEGEATVIANDGEAQATANNRINVSLDNNLVVNGTPESEAFTADDLTGVPVGLLTRAIAFNLAVPDFDENADDPAEENNGFGTAPTPASDDTTSNTGTNIDCTLTAPEIRNVRAGASTEFDIVEVLQANDSVRGVAQTLGELNLTWYQTENGGWIRIDTVESSAGCANLPVVDTPPLPEPTATPDSVINAGLSASQLQAINCDGTPVTGSATSNGVELYVRIGGTWTASAGTTATFTTQGGLLRPELGDLIQIVSEDGTVIARSGDANVLSTTFETDTNFEVRLSAANGDTVVLSARCDG